MRKLLSYSALISDFLLTINNENFVCNQTFTISSHPSWKHVFDALTELKLNNDSSCFPTVTVWFLFVWVFLTECSTYDLESDDDVQI